jgi:hypothetical protein
MHDSILRLDRSLGVFLDSLFKLRDPSRVAIAVTGDHGIGPIQAGERSHAGADACRRCGLAAALRPSSPPPIDTNRVDLDQQIVLADRNAPESAPPVSTAPESIRPPAPIAARRGEVDRFQDLLRGDTVGDAIARRWVHQLPAKNNVEMVITLTPFSSSDHRRYPRLAI